MFYNFALSVANNASDNIYTIVQLKPYLKLIMQNELKNSDVTYEL